MKIENRSIDTIRPYEGNPRVNDHAVNQVADSIREFGFQQPIIVDGEGIIIAGHTRHKAARRLGLVSVPVIVASQLSPDQARALRIADNKTGELAEWDLSLLSEELAALDASEFDLDVLGFTTDELNKLLQLDLVNGLVDPDDIPDPPETPTTQLGDLYTLGQHRLLCGDAGHGPDLDRLLDGAGIHLVLTDPPYNVRVAPRSKNAIAAGLSSFTNQKQESNPRARGDAKRRLRAKDRPLLNDFLSDDEFDELLDRWFGQLATALLPGRPFYIWGGYANCGNYPPVLKAHGLYFSQSIIWHKQHPVLSRKDFMGDHEWCFYGWREGAAHEFFGPSNASDVWSVKKVAPQLMRHLTEKPVELATRALQYSSRAGENVLDLFGGSGWTMIAAEQASRHAFLMELDPCYCDVIVARWEQYTGRKATRTRTAA